MGRERERENCLTGDPQSNRCAGGVWALAHPKVSRSSVQEAGGRFRIWDIHSHLGSVPGDTPEKRMEVLVRCIDRLGIELLLLSQGYSAQMHPTPDQFREENDRVLRAVGAFPDRAYGSVYLSPAYLDFSLQKFDRCVRDWSMVAIGEIEANRRANDIGLSTLNEKSRTQPLALEAR